MNWMKAGFLSSDKNLTVSPNYAKEVVADAEKGVELDDVIVEAGGMEGLVNGMDSVDFNPLKDKYLPVKYGPQSVVEGKAAAKQALQAEVGLEVDPSIPVIGFIGRLEEQKGVDILLAAIPETRMAVAVDEIRKSQDEMRALKKAIDDKNRQRDQGVQNIPESELQHYCTNCKVGGHGARFCEYLLKRPNWHVFPHQKWFQDEVKGDQYFCPLGKHTVDFVDETQFSSVAMYLKGRIWLEEKTKVFEMVPEIMPPTYIIVNRKWKGPEPPEATQAGITFEEYVEAPADTGWWEAAQKEPTAKEITEEEKEQCALALKGKDELLPWFLKEADRNWGTSVRCFETLEECVKYAKADSTYVVQRHIARPLLYEGRKAHIKFYILVNATARGAKWQYWSLRNGYLSIAPHPWSPKDVSKDMQVTIVRSQRIDTWEAWPIVYPKCRDATKIVFRRAVEERKLEGRETAQFEIMSADYIVDQDNNVFLLEFNTSPVLKDPKDSPDVHDGDMITGALGIVFPWEGSDSSCWELADEFEGPEFIPEAAPGDVPTVLEGRG